VADQNLRYYGDNLDVLRQHIKDEAVDLVYLDPPLFSNRHDKAAVRRFENRWELHRKCLREPKVA
jgi:16S rRNA G966 N2-methylase RsmD